MKYFGLVIIFAVLLAMPCFSQAAGSTLYVAVKSAELKNGSNSFANTVATADMGDALTVIRSSGNWVEVRTADNKTGWTQMAGLRARRVTGSGGTATTDQVALAGKGLNASVETEYRRSSASGFAAVDAMEKPPIPGAELQGFITEGRLRSDNSLDPTAESLKTELSLEDDYTLGRAVAASILSAYRPYVSNETLTRYLNRICQTIANNSSKPVIYNGYHVVVLDSMEYNAFASPGGHIMITRGLVEAVTSEDELAAIIAHEIAHIELRHAADIIERINFELEMGAVAGRAAAIAGSASSVSQRAANMRSMITGSIDAMMRNGFSQNQEYEADMRAVILLAASGYDIRALSQVLQILQRVQPNQSGGFNVTHPTPAMRLSVINPVITGRATADTRSFRASRFRNK
jgi:predicted Zn-dependent protease